MVVTDSKIQLGDDVPGLPGRYEKRAQKRKMNQAEVDS